MLMKRNSILIILGLISLGSSSFAQVNLDWAKDLGGPMDQQTWTMDVDNQGNVITAGIFQDTVDFDPGVGTYNLNSVGGYDMFVSKLDPNGNFIWAVQFEGTSSEYLFSISVDNSNNIYTTGVFDDTLDADPGAGANNLTTTGLNDIFVIKLDPNSNLIWAKQIGSNTHENAFSITSDYPGSVFITGVFNDTLDFDPSPTINNLVPHLSDAFVLRLNSNGDFIWVKNVGGTGYPSGKIIQVDNSGNSYTGGYYSNTVDFDPGPATFNMTADTFYNNTFILKLDLSGNFVWAKEFDSQSLSNHVQDMVVDSFNHLYLCGEFSGGGTTDFDPNGGVTNLTALGSTNGFVVALDHNGNLIWARKLGALGLVKCYDVDVNSNHDVYTTGQFGGSPDFDPDTSTYQLNCAGVSDIFISKLDSNGNFIWATGFGGNMDDRGYNINVTDSEKIYLSGHFNQTVDFDPNIGVTNLITNGSNDVFVCRLTDIETIGLNEPPNDFKFNIYPNPSSGIVTIESEPSYLTIYNQTGQIVFDMNIIQSASTLDLSNFANGIYLIRLTGNKSGTTKRLVILRQN